jgi:hypothetical protein
MYMSRLCAALFALLRLEYGFLRSHIRHRCQAVNSCTTVSYLKSVSLTHEQLPAAAGIGGLTFGYIYSSAWVTVGRVPAQELDPAPVKATETAINRWKSMNLAELATAIPCRRRWNPIAAGLRRSAYGVHRPAVRARRWVCGCRASSEEAFISRACGVKPTGTDPDRRQRAPLVRGSGRALLLARLHRRCHGYSLDLRSEVV